MDKNYGLDLSSISMELRLLLNLLKVEDEDCLRFFNDEITASFDWDLFLELARYHRVYPLIYTKIVKIDKKLVPENILKSLYIEYKKNTFKMLQLTSEIEQISRLFNANKIRLLFIKGPVIAADIYGEISLRTSKDLDILILRDDLRIVEELLINFGYQKTETASTLNGWKWMEHHVSFFHPEKGIEVEIHWRLHPPPMKEPSFNELWERKRVSLLTTYPVYYFGKEDLFSFLIVHGARHNWFRLRWLVDIDRMIRSGIIPEKKNNGKIRYQAIILSTQLLNTPINDLFKTKTIPIEKKSITQAQLALYYILEMGKLQINQTQLDFPKEQGNNLYLKMINMKKLFKINYYKYTMKSNLHKLIFLIKLLYPRNTDAEIFKLPKFFYFLYIPLRPFLWVWRKTSKKTL
ncbi:nucleotidyltransferase family protein [Peribacillus frigoritolerans]|uniref:nucleotidyltransferase domain-containing protein n=1 Tax=Peribacillus frigoritolerans TaxID=450367 RepID=UPI0032B370EC